MLEVFLHVSNGHGATGLIERSGVPGRTMVWCDPLYDGPVPANITDDELLRIRARFLAPTDNAVDEVMADLAGWRTAVDHTDAYDELVLWFEHDLFDQLNLVQLLVHLGRHEPWPKPATLISIDRHAGHPGFKGLSELTPSEIAALFPQRRPITRDQIALARRAWFAFRSADPRQIESVLSTDSAVLPFLASALSRHLEEFPSEMDGLSRSERRLMQQALDGPAELRRILPRMHDGEHAFYITDTMLMDRARTLASSAPALLTLTGDEPRAALPAATIALTAEGRAVLNGEKDRVAMCGVERWLGGVHLAGRGPIWRWCGTEVRLQ